MSVVYLAGCETFVERHAVDLVSKVIMCVHLDGIGARGRVKTGKIVVANDGLLSRELGDGHELCGRGGWLGVQD